MQSILLYVLGILIILIGLAVSIGLHEVGHLLPAKLFRVKVTQYMVGFGRTIWSRRRGETEYGVKAIPLGGYVAMIGMYPPTKPGEAPREASTGFLNSVAAETIRTGDPAPRPLGDAAEPAPEHPRGGIAGLVEDARAASAETIAAGDDERTYYRLAPWKKIIIMLGGPLMNLVLAFVFYGILVAGIGLPQLTTTLGSVSECVTPASSGRTECGPEDELAPGLAAGLFPGDRIVAIDGAPVASWAAFRDAISAAPEQTLQLTIERDGAERSVTLTPRLTERYAVDERGQVRTDASGARITEQVGMVGVSPTSEYVRQPLSAAGPMVAENIAAVGTMIVHLPERMVDIWQAAFGTEARDANGPISVVGVGRVAGEIASMDAVPVLDKAQVMVGLLASLNVALFIFNLLPLMPLDGGHIAGAIYEWIKRGIARVRGKPAPAPVDTAKMVPVTLVVVVLMGAMTLLLVYADLVKPVSLLG